MPSHSESPPNSLSQLVRNIFSDNYSNNIMLAAIVSLLLVILFVLLLHVYAKLFFPHSNPRRRRSPVTVSGVLDPSNFHTIIIEDPQICTKGLDSAIVSAIPRIVHKTEEAEELECVICLSVVEEGEVLRILPKCQHVFHVECIDTWLSSHCNCPICRAAIVTQNDSQVGSADENGVVEIVVGNSGYEIRESERGDEYEGYGSDSVSETSSSFLLGCALKRMLSKVFSVSELDGSH